MKCLTFALRRLQEIRERKKWCPQGDLNPCSRRERAASWTGLDDGDRQAIRRQSVLIAARAVNNFSDYFQIMMFNPNMFRRRDGFQSATSGI